MDWQHYTYLLVTAVAAAALFLLSYRFMSQLCVRTKSVSRLEFCLLSGVLILVVITIYGRFYLGDATFAYWDTGSDTIEQYVPFYINLVDNVREGQVGFWNFEFGLGTSALNYQSWLLDPFNLVLVPLGVALGDSSIAMLLVFVQSLKILFAGLLFDFLLTRYCDTPVARILGSVIYSCGGYLMLWGQHYWLGTAYVVLIVVVLSIERLLSRWSIGRCIGLAIIAAISLAWSVYCGFMILLISALYALLRIPLFSCNDGFKGYMKLFGRLAVPVICGCLIACITLLPYAMFLLGESSRVASNDQAALPQRILEDVSFVPLSWIPAILSRLMGSALITSGSAFPEGLVSATERFRYVNCYEFIMLGFSSGSIILIGQFLYWIIKEADRRLKILCIIAAALVLLYCTNFFLPSLLNVFVAPKYRSAFGVALPICIACSIGFERCIVRGKPSAGVLLISSLASFSVIAWSLHYSVDGKMLCAFSAIVVILLTVSIAVLHRLKPQPAFIVFICLIVTVSCTADGFFVTNNRSLCAPTDFPHATSDSKDIDTVNALSWIHEHDNGFYRIEKLYSDWTRLSDGLIQHYSGIASYNSTLDSDVEEFYDQLWPGMIAGGSAYQVFVDDPDHSVLLNMLGVRYLLSKVPLNYDWCSLVHQSDSVYVYQTESDDFISSAENILSESEANTLLSSVNRELALGNSIIAPDGLAIQYTSSQFDSHISTETRITSPSSITSSITCEADALLCIPIPNTSGWTILLDGIETDSFRANYGFIGLVVTAGTHELTAVYIPEGIELGFIFSIAGFATLALYIVGHKLQDRRSASKTAR